jgi:hypothetical protein
LPGQNNPRSLFFRTFQMGVIAFGKHWMQRMIKADF